MSLSLESFNRAFQRTRMISRNPGVFYGLKAIRLYLSANRNSPDLQFKVLTSGANSTLTAEACKVFAVFAKKGNSATASFLKVSNHATQVQASSDIILRSNTANEEILLLYPDGHTLGTGLAAGSYTAYDGSNATTPSTAGDHFSGFILIGANA